MSNGVDTPGRSDGSSAGLSAGHTVVRGLGAGVDLDRLRRHIAPHAERAARRLDERGSDSTYDRAFLQLTNLWQRDDVIAEFTLHDRFARAAADLLGVGAVRLYHDQALIKTAPGGHTPWHQDQAYWPLDGARAVTMWMALVDCTPEMGTMRFVSGSHRRADGIDNDLRHVVTREQGPISDASHDALGRWILDTGAVVTEPVEMAAGDASFHLGWTVHGAPPNTTQRPREAMTVIYVEDGATVSTPDTPERAFDLVAWLPGCQPGDPVAGPLNPLLC